MKNFLLSATLVAMAHLYSDAQWIYDPENPQLVSDAINVQNNVRQVADGNGGTFVYWMDGRMDYYNPDIYGQHYDANGTEQWESGGRSIFNNYGTVKSFDVFRSNSDGEMIMGVHTGTTSIAPDSLRFQKLNDEGEKLWSEDLLVAKSDGCTGNYFLGLENFQFFRNENGDYTVNLVPTYCGGSDGCRLTHFTSEGILTGTQDGEPEGNQYYIGSRGIDKTYDGSNDTYLYYTGGNGAGAHAFVMRVTEAGDSAFAPVDVLDGTNGINYQYAAMSDEDGIAVCFQSSGENGNVDLFMRKLNGNGTWAWGGDIMDVCVADGNQGSFHWVQDDTYYYIVWADGRPGVVGNAAIYAQKIEKATGEMQWQQDGIEVFDQNTYIPYPKCILNESGQLVVTNESNGENGFNAQVLNQDGTLEWPNTPSLATLSFSPFYADYSILKSNENIIVAWSRTFSGGGADGIYVAKVKAPTTSITETISACDSYTINGETFTQSGVYSQELPGDTVLTLDLTITTIVAEATLNGTTLTATNTEGNFSFLDCDSNNLVSIEAGSYIPSETGNYALIVELNGCQDTSECFHIVITDVAEINLENQITLFPNPGNDGLNVQSTHSLKNAELKITDSNGRLVFSKNSLSGKNFVFELSDLPVGIYQVNISYPEHHYTMKWARIP